MSAPFLPTPADTRAAQQQLTRLVAGQDELSPGLAELMTQMLSQLAAGKAVQVTTVDTEIGTGQAADLLGVSRPYLVKQLEAGALPYRKVGPRRRMKLEDVMGYKAKLDQQRRKALQSLADDLQEMGLD
ncbi:excisionase family DNA-binding protein [Deinococcus sp. Marseille-Q6407]|uniref:excisionase family DNA-binding protein n=1 Tax=Deinococcus sp. Marseille-Q6407 TaxID=2969223 RepID=UPI0021BE65C2|nr:excisionase family DNA-binding protein [Deinococcus sp. Marseille-Q6407]